MSDTPKPVKRGRRLGAGAVSVAGHLIVVAALFTAVAPTPRVPPEPVVVEIVPPFVFQPPAPKSTPAPPAPEEAPPAKPTPDKTAAAAKKATPKPATPKSMARETPVRRNVETLPVAPGDGDRLADLAAFGVSDSELAGAAAAGSGGGGGGGGCDMAVRVQAALRKDPLARAAVVQAHGLTGGRPIRIWNGDWVQSPLEDGKGLSAVREAIMWEVAFAPEACKHQTQRGLITLSLNDSTRIVVGGSHWRWSDMLGRR